MSGFINIKEFGAIGDSTTDDTKAIQNAINDAESNNLALYIPSGSYKISTTLLISKRIKIYGDGMGLSKIIYEGRSSAIKIQPPTNGSSNTFYDFRDFGIEPEKEGSGTYGIEIVLRENAYFSNWEMQRVYIGNFGNYGLRLDNDIKNTNGFFTATIRRCWITNGINGSNLGDSITISENTITGRKLGVLTSHLSGARQVVIRENNITTQGGAIALIGAEQPMIYNNQIEQPAYKGDYKGLYPGLLYFLDVSFAEIKGNTISPAASAVKGTSYSILFDGKSRYNTITDNNISKGEIYHIGFSDSSIYNTIENDNTYDSPLKVLNKGVNNKGVSVPLIPQNNWIVYSQGKSVTIKKLENGLIVVSGALKSGEDMRGTVITTLPIGFRPANQKVFQVTNFNGTSYSNVTLQVHSNGNVQLMTSVSNKLLYLDGIQFEEN
nr:glycoside hydrolase family 55 protein [Peribacillus sp. TH16]